MSKPKRPQAGKCGLCGQLFPLPVDYRKVDEHMWQHVRNGHS